MKTYLADYITMLRVEKNLSPHSIEAYERDRLEYEKDRQEYEQDLQRLHQIMEKNGIPKSDANIQVLRTETNKYKRGVLEAIEIKRQKPDLNQDPGRHWLSPIYDNILL